jgi:hypothetical protein
MRAARIYLLTMTSPTAIPLRHNQRRYIMKAIMLALTLFAATGAPVLADGFPNPYQTNFDR